MGRGDRRRGDLRRPHGRRGEERVLRVARRGNGVGVFGMHGSLRRARRRRRRRRQRRARLDLVRRCRMAGSVRAGEGAGRVAVSAAIRSGRPGQVRVRLRDAAGGVRGLRRRGAILGRAHRDGHLDGPAQPPGERFGDRRAQPGLDHIAGESVGHGQQSGVFDDRPQPGQPEVGALLR
jgi:hypothetical protein